MFTRVTVSLIVLICAMGVSCGDEDHLSTTSENKTDGFMNGVDKGVGSQQVISGCGEDVYMTLRLQEQSIENIESIKQPPLENTACGASSANNILLDTEEIERHEIFTP